jgi:hypothetical protein
MAARRKVNAILTLLALPLLACAFSAAEPFARFVDSIQQQVEKIGKVGLTPLDPEILDRLDILWGGFVQLQPGETLQLQVGTVECCYVFQEVEVPVTWSVQPVEGVTLDPESGMLVIDQDTPHDSRYTITADVENGRKLLQLQVIVYTPQGNPLAGAWHESAQLLCGSGEEIEPAERIGELTISANGELSVTWHPFEIYHDYHATYTYDLETGEFAYEILGGSYIPEDVDTLGSFSIDEQGRLVFTDLWFGSPRDATPAANCGHIFVSDY